MRSILYISSIGAKQLMDMQTISANNLANVSTNGFKADYAKLNSVRQSAAQKNINSSMYTQINSIKSDLSNGAYIETNRELDLAIQGKGWFVVKTAAGEEVYTRNGNFQVSPEGILIDSSNRTVLGSGGEIAIPANHKVEIGTDGTVSVVPFNSSNPLPIVLDKVKLVNPDNKNLAKGQDGLFRTLDGSVAEIDTAVTVSAGVLESSNVNAIKELTNMISLARQYEMQMKLVSSAEENDKASSSVINA